MDVQQENEELKEELQKLAAKVKIGSCKQTAYAFRAIEESD